MKESESIRDGAFSRRSFLRGLGTSAVVTAAAQAQAVVAQLEPRVALGCISPVPH